MIKRADAYRSFKLTKEGQNSFTLVDSSREVKDARPLRSEQTDITESGTLETPKIDGSSVALPDLIRRYFDKLGENSTPAVKVSVVEVEHEPSAHLQSNRILRDLHNLKLARTKEGAEKSDTQLKTTESSFEKSGHGKGSPNEARLNAWADAHIKSIEDKLHDKVHPPDAKEQARLRVEELELQKFKRGLEHFKHRPSIDGMDSAEVEKTLLQLDLLTKTVGETPMPSIDRLHVAEQIMHQAAYPQSIDQGNHNTCNVATVEARTYTRTRCSRNSQ